jgi:hypothetical protein
MKLTETEEKFARFALDGAATENERKVAAEHLLKSLRDRGIKTEDIEREEVRVGIVRAPEPAPAPRPHNPYAAPTPEPATQYASAPRPAGKRNYALRRKLVALGVVAVVGLIGILVSATRHDLAQVSQIPADTYAVEHTEGTVIYGNPAILTTPPVTDATPTVRVERAEPIETAHHRRTNTSPTTSTKIPTQN